MTHTTGGITHVLYDIVIWPDPRLTTKSQPIEVFDDALRTLVKDMIETMYANDGGGLAANQIGICKRLFVIDVSPDYDGTCTQGPMAIINPKWISKSGSSEMEEACISLPGESGFVKRAANVVLEYQDVDGNVQQMTASGLLATTLQHENDHIDGKLWVDYQSRLKREFVRKKMLKYKASQHHHVHSDSCSHSHSM